MNLITDIARAEGAAAAASCSDLPDHLQEDADEILAEYGKSLTAEGYDPAQVASGVAGLLLRIAFFEAVPESVDEIRLWLWENNYERRRDNMPLADGRFGHAVSLWTIRNGTEEEAACARRYLADPDWQYGVAREREKEAAPSKGRGRKQKGRPS